MMVAMLMVTGIIIENVSGIVTPIIAQNFDEKVREQEEQSVEEYHWDGPVLNSVIGVVQGPSGKETYYNLNMSYVIELMRASGYDYEYWVRDDGVKMYGNYVMCAANLDIRPKGTVIETSLGTGIVCDTGEFAFYDPTQIDIAVTW